MTESQAENSERPVDSPEPASDKQDLIIDLNFVPIWARQSSSENPYAHFAEGRDSARRRDESRSRPRGPGDDRRPRGRDEPRRDGRPFRPGRPDTRSHGQDDRGRSAPSAAPEISPIDVDFLPERRALPVIAKRVAMTRRAYSLFEVPGLFLSRPEYHAVRVSLPAKDRSEAAQAESLFQCTECGAVFLDKAGAWTHGFEKHLDLFYRKEEKDGESPKGNFVCVARCGFSGEILGPPNYHGFNDAVLEIHRTKFPHLSIEQYRQRIENVRDPALIEQWKDKMRKQTVYQSLRAGEPKTFARIAEAEADFREHHAASLIREGRHFVLPGTVSQSLADPQIRRQIRDAWNHETRFPLKFSITLRLAFRHFGLHVFKTANGGTFVTAICPSAIDPSQTIPLIREILEYLAANPGCKFQKLAEGIRPEAASDSPEVSEVRKQLGWLIDKGHVIEFSDGKMAVPVNSVRRIQPGKKPLPKGR